MIYLYFLFEGKGLLSKCFSYSKFWNLHLFDCLQFWIWCDLNQNHMMTSLPKVLNKIEHIFLLVWQSLLKIPNVWEQNHHPSWYAIESESDAFKGPFNLRWKKTHHIYLKAGVRSSNSQYTQYTSPFTFSFYRTTGFFPACNFIHTSINEHFHLLVRGSAKCKRSSED